MKSALLSFLAIAFLGSSNALAIDASGGGWREVSSTTEKASTPEEFANLQQKYPNLFVNVDPSKVTNGYVTLHEVEYAGTSVCPAGDPRLKKTVKSYGVCYVDSSCQSTSEMIPSYDPCRAQKP